MSDYQPDEIVMGRTPDRRYRVVFSRVLDPSTLGPHVALSPCGNYRVLFRPVPGSNPEEDVLFNEDGDVRALPPTPPRSPRPSRASRAAIRSARDFPPYSPRSPSASPPHQPVDSPRRGVRRPRDPSPQTRSVRMRTMVQDMVGALNPELMTELTLAINRRLRDALRRRSPSPPPVRAQPPPPASATQTEATTTRPSSAAVTTTSCGGLPPISSVLPPRGSPPPPQLPPAGPPTPPSSPGVVRPQAVRGRPGRTPPQRPSNPPRIVRRNNGRVVTFVSTQPRPRPLMRTTASAFATAARRRAREGAVAGAPVSSSAERETQAVPSAPPMDQDDSDSDRTISPAMSLLSTASTPPMNPSASPVLFEHVYVDPDADREAWSSTPPPACNPPACLHLTCLPIWGERVTSQPPILQDCLLCREDQAHHSVRCRQCEQLSGCCSCIWRYQRSRYNSGCPCCQYTGLLPPNRRQTAATQTEEEEEFWDLPDLPE